MSSADGDGSGPGADQGPPGWRPLIWKRLLEVLAALAAVATIATLLLQIHGSGSPGGSGGGDGASSSASAQQSAATIPASATPSAQQPALRVGTCLPPTLDRATRCDAAHRYEVVSTGACTSSALIQYLGGRPDLEILRVQPHPMALPSGATACLVQDPTTDNPPAGVAGVLRGPDHGSGWRLCRDDRTAQDVPCSQRHTGEYVLTASNAPVDCEQAAADYLGAPPLRFKSQLQVVRLQRVDGPQCLVAVQGADLLTSTLRNIATNAPPIVSP